VVIGCAGRRVAREQALRHVAGYMCAQDLTSRALLRGDTDLNPLFLQPTHGKGVDSFCPTGPWLVSADEVADPGALSIRTWVNNELRQDGSTAEMIVAVPELIEWLSTTFTLLPGDIILTGTPAGMGGALDPPRSLRHGDVVRTAIAGLGEMINQVIETAEAPGD
jgi:2,4-didehydro-3-deoxy-L-rhamnonate hydrolase